MKRLCNLTWYYLSRNMDDAGRTRLTATLEEPLPGQAAKTTPETAAREMEMFRQAQGALPGNQSSG